MTLGTLLVLASGRRIGFRDRLNLQAQMNALHVGSVVSLMRRIVLFVFLAELIGAAFLYSRFGPTLGRGQGIFTVEME